MAAVFSRVVLAGSGRTDVLEPGASQTLEICDPDGRLSVLFG